MRKSLLVGAVLTVTAVLVVVLSDLFDLKLDAVTLLGVALGAVVALVPDRTPAMHMAGFAVGFVAVWVAYLLRAGMLPDSTGGRAFAVALVMVICVAVATLSMGRVPLWASLLGAAALTGAYEYTYTLAPAEVAGTSMTAATSLLMTAAFGFLVVALLAPGPDDEAEAPRAARPKADDGEHHAALDDMMETSK